MTNDGENLSRLGTLNASQIELLFNCFLLKKIWGVRGAFPKFGTQVKNLWNTPIRTGNDNYETKRHK